MHAEDDKTAWDTALDESALAGIVDEKALSELINEHIRDAVKAFMAEAAVSIEGDKIKVFELDCIGDFVAEASLEATLTQELLLYKWHDGTGRFSSNEATLANFKETLSILEETARMYREAIEIWTIDPDDEGDDAP